MFCSCFKQKKAKLFAFTNNCKQPGNKPLYQVSKTITVNLNWGQHIENVFTKHEEKFMVRNRNINKFVVNIFFHFSYRVLTKWMLLQIEVQERIF